MPPSIDDTHAQHGTIRKYDRPKATFENRRYRMIAETFDAGWVWGTEVIDLKFHEDNFYVGKVLTLTSEYATIAQLQDNYHDLYNRC